MKGISMSNGLQALLVAAAIWLVVTPAQAQAPVVANQDHAAMLASNDPALAANKWLVYDFWREVFEAAQMDRAANYLTEAYIQHNPMVPSGRQAFIDFFSRFKKPAPISDRVAGPLVAITAEKDLVVLSFVREYPDPKDPAKTYTTTWFDMFRIEGGKIAEHWDSALKRP